MRILVRNRPSIYLLHGLSFYLPRRETVCDIFSGCCATTLVNGTLQNGFLCVSVFTYFYFYFFVMVEAYQRKISRRGWWIYSSWLTFIFRWNSTEEIGRIGRHRAETHRYFNIRFFGQMPPDASDFPGGIPA